MKHQPQPLPHGAAPGKHHPLVPVKRLRLVCDPAALRGVTTRVREERENADGQLVEVSRNFVAPGVKTGNLYYFGEDVDEYKHDKLVSHGGVWRAGEGGALRLGDRYYQEHAPGVALDRAEKVSTKAMFKTPAGKFQHCLKIKETTPLEPENVEYQHYAPGIGLIQDGHLRLVKHGFARI